MITDSLIGYGDQLGAQMSTLANLIYVSKENNQNIVFYKELLHYRRGVLFFKNFVLNSSITVINRHTNFFPFLYKIFSPKASMKRIYFNTFLQKVDHFYYKNMVKKYTEFTVYNKLINNIHCDSRLLSLNSNDSYDIQNGFGSYQDWKKYASEISTLFTFTDDIKSKSVSIFSEMSFSKKKIVSVHFRRTDYLSLSSLNLTDDYYRRALALFPPYKYQLLIFSDDIKYCKSIDLFNEYEVTFMKNHKAAVDMCVMSLCDSNIIANSSFSFWGAYLNAHVDKHVVCPHDYIGSKDSGNAYINGNWYPDNWTAL